MLKNPFLISYARELAAKCGHAEAARIIHLLCEELEEADRERTQLAALQTFSLMAESDKERGFEVRIKEDPTGLLKMWVLYFGRLLDDPSMIGGAPGRAENYLSTELFAPNVGRYFVEIRRGTGKSAAQMRLEAEQERDQLKAELATIREQLRAQQGPGAP